jgi:hypothetical protein
MGNVSTERYWARNSTNSTDEEAEGAVEAMFGFVGAAAGAEGYRSDVIVDGRGAVDERRFSFLAFLLRAVVFLPSQTVQTYGLVL